MEVGSITTCTSLKLMGASTTGLVILPVQLGVHLDVMKPILGFLRGSISFRQAGHLVQ